MVTRTIKGTHVNVMCLNVVEGEPFNQTVDFPLVFKDEAKMLKACKAKIDTDEVKAVHIVASEIFETLYGLTEAEFLERATVLPPRGSSSQTEGTEEEDEEAED